MKIAVMGTGGVGGYFGGRLAAKKFDVSFIARGGHLAAIRRYGLRVESAKGNIHLKHVKATDKPKEIGPVDYVLFTVKLADTESAIEAIRPLIGKDTAVISLQNGVDAEPLLSEKLGLQHVMGGLAFIAAVITAPGVIKHTGTMARVVFGELDGTRTPRAETLLAAFRDAGVDAEISDNIEKAIWEKFIFLVALSGVTTVTRKPIGVLRADTDTRALLRAVMAEVAAVARAQGIGIDDAFVDNRLAFADTLPPEMTSSMHEDLERGNRLELDWLAGTVVRLGREFGIATPANAFIYAALKHRAGGEKD